MSSQNALNNQVYDNDFTVNRRDAGPSDVGVVCRHLDGTNVNNNAFLIAATTAGGGDPGVRMAIDAVQEYPFGIQHATNDLVMGNSPGTPSSTNVVWRMTPNAERTMPFQPAFLALLPAVDVGVTGAGATYTLGGATALTVTQQGTGMATTGVYTAPVAGWYRFSASMNVANITVAMTQSQITLNCSDGRIIYGDVLSPFTILSGGVIQYNVTGLINLAAADTMTCQLIILNGALDTADVNGGPANLLTHFSGALLF